MAAVVSQALEIAPDIVAADHVQHHRDALAIGQSVDDLDVIGGAVVDRVSRAQFDRGGAFVVRSARDDDIEPEQGPKLDRHRADSAGPAVDEHRVAVGGKAALEQVDPYREQGLGQRRGLGQA